MACRFFGRGAGCKARPWMLKQVQHDELGATASYPKTDAKKGLSYNIRLCQPSSDA
jgi:hypothetical protein